MTPLQDIFSALNAASIEYIVAGGIAVNLHGVERLTADVDLVLHLERENIIQFDKIMRQLGLRTKIPVTAEQFADEHMRQQWIDEKNMVVFSYVNPNNPMELVDIFVQHPLPYDQLAKNCVRKEAFGTTIPIIGLDDLIILKRQAGRPKDMYDLGFLEALQERDADGQ